jgi:hypothetical protein
MSMSTLSMRPVLPSAAVGAAVSLAAVALAAAPAEARPSPGKASSSDMPMGYPRSTFHHTAFATNTTMHMPNSPAALAARGKLLW